MVHEHDPEPERYYNWMLWKLRQEKDMDDPLDSPTDDVTKGNLFGWIEKPHLSKEQMWMREVAEMQKANHYLLLRVKEQAEHIEKLKEKINAEL